MKRLLPIGRFSRLFGDEGAMMLNLYDTFKGEIDYREPLFVKIDRLTVPFFVEEFERRGQSGATIKLADIDNQTRAMELLDLELLMKSEVVKEKSETDSDMLYFDDLVGYGAIIAVGDEDRKKSIKGEIVDFVDSEMNPLLVIAVDEKEVMIPANNELISFVDTDLETIEFKVPDGLLELYLEE